MNRNKFLTLFVVLLSGGSFTNAQSEKDVVDLGLSVCWASHNIGASRPEDFGWYLAWGEFSEKDKYTFETYKYWAGEGTQSTIDIGSNISGTQYDMAKNLWKGEWRLPTEEEAMELRNECDWRWDKVHGVVGARVTGPNGNSIFLPAAGEDKGRYGAGTAGKYWTGALSRGLGRSAYALEFLYYEDGSRLILWGEYKTSGLTVRPVMTNPNYKPTFRIDSSNAQLMEWQETKYEEVLQGLLEENYEQVFNSFTILAATGDPKSQCALATMYCFPAGTTRDYAAAYNLLKKAALQDYERAEYLLGSFGSLDRMRQGEVYQLLGITDFSVIDDNFWQQCFKAEKEIQSYKDAFEWFYMKDGHWGYRDIMYYAALVFLDDSSELYNKEKGLKWLRRSAELDYPDARRLLEQYGK